MRKLIVLSHECSVTLPGICNHHGSGVVHIWYSEHVPPRDHANLPNHDDSRECITNWSVLRVFVVLLTT